MHGGFKAQKVQVTVNCQVKPQTEGMHSLLQREGKEAARRLAWDIKWWPIPIALHKSGQICSKENLPSEEKVKSKDPSLDNSPEVSELADNVNDISSQKSVTTIQ